MTGEVIYFVILKHMLLNLFLMYLCRINITFFENIQDANSSLMREVRSDTMQVSFFDFEFECKEPAKLLHSKSKSKS